MACRAILKVTRLGLPAFVVPLTACAADNASTRILKQLASEGAVDLQAAVPVEWERVCVLGPYSGNADAARTLGFDWPVEQHARISQRDDISLLLFVRGNDVAAAVEHGRKSGDFSPLSGLCFRRGQARFVARAGAEDGWPLLGHDEAR